MSPEMTDTLIMTGMFALILFQAWLIQENYKDIKQMKEEIKEIKEWSIL